jgi:hypothetical protein
MSTDPEHQDTVSGFLKLRQLAIITINVPLFKKPRDINSLCGKLKPLKMSLEMAHKVIVPPKKIMSQSFLNTVLAHYVPYTLLLIS